MYKYALLVFSLLPLSALAAPELEIAHEQIEPGIAVVFEGAIKDDVAPHALHLKESDTDVHIEARVNWADTNAPKGAPAGGFVPYLHITAKVVNEKTGKLAYVDLLPHVNLVDNFHYARNMALPGARDEKYTITFNIEPPREGELSYHHDWQHQQKTPLFEPVSYTYKHVDFQEIAEATRR
tara:strand:+ start:751 stop:1293 length:543 start_codon:yes stop_codon:yes gene_type:complete